MIYFSLFGDNSKAIAVGTGSKLSKNDYEKPHCFLKKVF